MFALVVRESVNSSPLNKADLDKPNGCGQRWIANVEHRGNKSRLPAVNPFDS
jgi:hypothetical protein